MAEAKRDENRVPTVLAETNNAARTPTPILVDPVTGRVLVDIDTSGLAAGPGYQATSTTSLAIGTGNKTFTTQAGLAYTAGARARASSAADTADFMEGLVVSYSGTTLIINVDRVGGSGTDADWNINLAGDVGATGAAGADGDNAYVYIAYASDASGTDFTLVFNAALNYIAVLNSTVEIPSPVVGDFAGLWKNYKGATGSTGATGAAGAGKRGFTKIVGASDSVSQVAGDYDYLCDGTDDDVQIQAAIDALPASGGRVILMEGNFLLGTTVIISKSGVTIEGQGKGTIVKLKNAGNVNMFNLGHATNTYTGINFLNIYFDGNAANQTTAGSIIDNGNTLAVATTYLTLKNCYFVDPFDWSVIDSGDYGLIDGCFGIGGLGTADGVVLAQQGNNGGIITNSQFTTTLTGVQLALGDNINNCTFVLPDSFNTTVMSCSVALNNTIAGGNTLGASFVGINAYKQSIGNYIFGNGGAADIASVGILAGYVTEGNYIFQVGIGISIESNYNKVIGNTLRSIRTNAIIMVGTLYYIEIANNLIQEPSAATDNTYSGIKISASSIFANVHGNQVVGSAVAGSSLKYGIEEESGAGPSIVTNNVVVNAETADIFTTHASTDVSHNLTGTGATPN